MLQLLIDYRLGGKPRWYLASPGEAQDMQIPESARRSIVFVCYRDPKGMRLAGTAFFVSEQMEGFESWFIYLVTARHVIAKIKEKSVDHKAYLRVNPKDGRPPHLVDVDVDRWVFPEDDPFTDIAAMMWAPPENVIDYQSVRGTVSDRGRGGRPAVLPAGADDRCEAGLRDGVGLRLLDGLVRAGGQRERRRDRLTRGVG